MRERKGEKKRERVRKRERGRKRKKVRGRKSEREREREGEKERERVRKRERERERKREIERDVEKSCFIFKRTTGALAPFSYLVNEMFFKHSVTLTHFFIMCFQHRLSQMKQNTF